MVRIKISTGCFRKRVSQLAFKSVWNWLIPAYLLIFFEAPKYPIWFWITCNWFLFFQPETSINRREKVMKYRNLYIDKFPKDKNKKLASSKVGLRSHHFAVSTKDMTVKPKFKRVNWLIVPLQTSPRTLTVSQHSSTVRLRSWPAYPLGGTSDAAHSSTLS